MRSSRMVAFGLPALCATGALLHASCSGPHPATSVTPVVDAGPDTLPTYTRIPYDAAVPSGPTRVPVHSEIVNDRVDTRTLMFAAGEMQTSGEPFANQFAGRNLGDYDRYYLPTDQYLLHPDIANTLFVSYTDLFGFSTAVESYEYSKYHMNMLLQQTGAGVSLINGPLLQAFAGATPRDQLRTRVEQLLTTAGTAVGGFAFLPPPVDNPQNDFGFPGLWPEFAPYKSFDPTIAPLDTIVHSCTNVTSIGYGGVQMFGDETVPIYECDYKSLHLPNRTAQIEPTIGPGILGFMTWKAALWSVDFTGRLHDSNSNPVNAINPNDGPRVGTPGNTVTGTDPPPCPPMQVVNCSAVGTYIGSTPLEGMWGMLMVDEMDNAAEWLLTSLSTSDGATLGGWSSHMAAIAYDYGSPLRWFPTAIAVTEDGSTPYPMVQSLAITDATSHSEDLAAILRGEGLFFGMTDARNAPVGQQLGLQLTFNGVTFPADDGLPDGEPSPHDRSLGLIRTAFIDLDRMHADPSTGIIADTATVNGGVVTRSSSVTTTSLTHVLLGLRTALMGLNATVSQYGAPDDNPAEDVQGILNALAIHPPSGTSANFSARVRQVFDTNAAFVRDVLTKADGTVANGATLAGGKATANPGVATIDSQTAAIRALIEGFLMTGDATYQARARLLVQHLDKAFYSLPARMYRETDSGPDQNHMTPERFAWLQSSLRETYKTLSIAGDPVLGRNVLEDRIERTNKLFLNGWDDLTGDQSVNSTTKPNECLAARMQPGEQALTGEVGHDSNGTPAPSGPDRDVDCVLELSHAKKTSTLPSEVYFHSP